jgi:hypothetical protein
MFANIISVIVAIVAGLVNFNNIVVDSTLGRLNYAAPLQQAVWPRYRQHWRCADSKGENV